MNAEHCRLCGEPIDENGGDGLCAECYFDNADSEWLAEHYPWLLDDAEESADDSQPQRRSRHATTTCGSNSATSRTATGHHQVPPDVGSNT